VVQYLYRKAKKEEKRINTHKHLLQFTIMYHHVVCQPYFGLKPLVADLADKSVGLRVVRLHVMPEQHEQKLLQK
jgi:hypothetical protein